MIGRTISHYKILSKLGEGGMGVVYKAEDTKLKRIVALKFLPLQAVGEGEQRAHFEREARVAAALNHPNVCTIYEVDEAGGQPFITMEFVEGEPLAAKIESGPLKIDDALDITIQAARGLAAAHEREIVHRDVKSANMMVVPEKTGHERQVKLMDFGLAHLANANTQLTKEGTTLGTMSYMAPEQASGEKIDRGADIWALGVVLYEMIAGQQPFRGEYEQRKAGDVPADRPSGFRRIRISDGDAVRFGAPAAWRRLRSRFSGSGEAHPGLCCFGQRNAGSGLCSAHGVRAVRPCESGPRGRNRTVGSGAKSILARQSFA